ncbi:MAG: hypothetical protein K0S70_377 [Microbacterium sp.]|jgi:hypothetical protein|nr:hypothetical protein [Microbacterium sp.]
MPPVLRVYFGPIPAGCVGVGQGVYDEAGYCGPRWLRPIVRLFAGRGVMFPERGAHVPFVVVNMPRRDGSLHAERDFLFAGARRRMVDAMSCARTGEIVDRLGRRGGLEVRLRAEADLRGMRMRSVGLAVRLGAARLPLPPVAAVAVTETADHADAVAQRVEVSVRAWLVGELFRYHGSFTYRIQPADGNPVRGVVPPCLD